MLRQRESDREPPWIRTRQCLRPLVGEPEEGAVQRVDREPGRPQPGPRVTSFPSTATSE